MIFLRYSFYLTNLFALILGSGEFYPEYEQYYEGMDANQQKAFKYYVRSYRKYNKTISHIPKDKLATMDEYLDTSGRGTMIQDVLYDNLKEIHVREKAIQKYSHPDDQELYLAVKKYTPTIASSEISNWIHTINNRYRNILGLTTTFDNSTKKSTTEPRQSTRFSPRFTIFKEGEDPWASSEYGDESKDYQKVRPTFKKRKIERYFSDADQHQPSETKIRTNLTAQEKNSVNNTEMTFNELMVREYFKSQNINYSNDHRGGFQTCPTGSPLSQEKLINEFNEMCKIPDMRIEEIFRNYENRSIYNESYIEEYIRANNISTLWVSDLPELNNTHHTSICTAVEFKEYQTNLTSTQNTVQSDNDNTSFERKEGTTPTSITENGPGYNSLFFEHTKVKITLGDSLNLIDNRDPFTSVAEHDSFKSFLLAEAKKRNNSLDNFIQEIDEHKALRNEPLVTDNPVFNSSYYKYIESKFEDFENGNNKMLLDRELSPRYEHTPFDPQKEEFYQDRIFDKELFQNSAELVGRVHHVDKLYPSVDNTLQYETTKFIVNVPPVPDKSKYKDEVIPNYEKNVRGSVKLEDMSETLRQSTCLNVIKQNEEIVKDPNGCATCSNHTFRHRSYRRRKTHRSHKRRHYKRHRGHQYIPPNPPFLYNQYCPPPFPYPPQYYQHPQPPNFYQFTAQHYSDNERTPSLESTTEDQFALYLKLKNIFQPVDKVLKDMGTPPQIKTAGKLNRASQTTRMYKYTIPPLPIRNGTMDPADIQKFLEKFLDLPPPPPVNSSTDNPGRIMIEKILPKGIYEDQRYFYTGCTRSILDHHPDYPAESTSPRKHGNHHRTYKGRHRHCCCHHHHHGRRPRKYRGRNPRRKYHAGGIVEETLIDSRDIKPEDLERGKTGFRDFDYTSFETLYRGLKYGSERPITTSQP